MASTGGESTSDSARAEVIVRPTPEPRCENLGFHNTARAGLLAGPLHPISGELATKALRSPGRAVVHWILIIATTFVGTDGTPHGPTRSLVPAGTTMTELHVSVLGWPMPAIGSD
jgi:hypothetical protein